MKTRALVKIYSGMILLGIDAFYLVWLDFTLRKLELDHRLEDGYVSSFEEVITGHYINDMWPCTLFCLRWAYSALSAC